MVFKMRHIVLKEKIGHGTFGEVYSATYERSPLQLAVKIEKRASRRQLDHEYSIYQTLLKTESSYVPKIYGIGTILHRDHESNALAMELLGLSLEKLFVECDSKFSYKTVLMLADLMLSRIEFLHHKNFIHRDIKPDNFMFGLNDASHFYLIDYGLAKQYRNPVSCVHIPMRTDKSLTGTTRFCSLNAHRGMELSRRDDLEAFGYVLVYFLKGKLPWQGMPSNTKEEKYRKIKKSKEDVSAHELCENLPGAILQFVLYVKHLEFSEMPNYQFLRSLISNEIVANKYNFDYDFDWLINRRKKQAQIIAVQNRRARLTHRTQDMAKEKQNFNEMG